MENKKEIVKHVGIAFFLTASSLIVSACGEEQGKIQNSLPNKVEKEVKHVSDAADSAMVAPTIGCGY